MKEEEILTKAVKKFGKDLQVNQAIQEMAELIAELTKSIQKNNMDNISSILEEMADVEVTQKQLKIVFGNYLGIFKAHYKNKVNRLEGLVK